MFSFEKERQRPCARVSADDGADIIYGDLVSGEVLMDQSDRVFDVLEAIPVSACTDFFLPMDLETGTKCPASST